MMPADSANSSSVISSSPCWPRMTTSSPGSTSGRCDTSAMAISMDTVPTRGARRVGGVLEPQDMAFGLELLADGQVPRQLLMGEERVGIVGRGEVGVEAFQAQAGQLFQAAHDSQRLFLGRAVAGHARVDLNLHVDYTAGGSSSRCNALGCSPIGERWRQGLFDDFGV